MIDTVLKLLSGQALNPGPALDRSITRVKYDLAAALVAAAAVAMGVVALSAAGYMWLTTIGLPPTGALLILGGGLVLFALIAWTACAHVRDREMARLQAEEEAQAQSQTGDLTQLLISVAQELGQAFVDGIKDQPAPGQENAPQQDDQKPAPPQSPIPSSAPPPVPGEPDR
jgi:hypothetical protein